MPRFLSPPKSSFFLFGPRGTGKSMWLANALPNAFRLDLLDPETERSYRARPERLREIVAAHRETDDFVIDEVQRAPDLLPVVHSLLEADERRRFVLTGSSARKLKRAGVDLLAGRAVLRTMHPFMAAEIGARFELERALRLGLLPLVSGATDPADTLRGYAALYLREEVQLEGLVRNVGTFARFLEAVSFSHGQPLNLSAVSRECEVERKSVEGYVAILEDLLLAFRIPLFTRRAQRALSAHPKLFLFDSGVYRSLRPTGPLDRPEEIDGAALEGLVAQHLQAWIAYRSDQHTLHFWRTRARVEVDFVIYGSTGVVAIEVKNTARLRPEDLRGLATFREDYPESKAFLLYRGRERSVQRGVLCVPAGEFLSALDPRRPIGEGF